MDLVCIKRIWKKWLCFGRQPTQEYRVLLFGLDAAGKTSILYKLKLGGKIITTIPTIGFNVETVKHENYSFTCWDVGGKDKIRPLWRHYYQNTSAIVYVVVQTTGTGSRKREMNYIDS